MRIYFSNWIIETRATSCQVYVCKYILSPAFARSIFPANCQWVLSPISLYAYLVRVSFEPFALSSATLESYSEVTPVLARGWSAKGPAPWQGPRPDGPRGRPIGGWGKGRRLVAAAGRGGKGRRFTRRERSSARLVGGSRERR